MLRLIVLCGGRSDERAVSLRSGAAVAAALQTGARTQWPEPVEVLALDPAQTDLATFGFHSHDLCVNVLHGAWGEDGGVQTLLDELGIPYTGCDADAARLTFSKRATRDRLQTAGVPVPLGFVVSANAPLPTERPYPLVVKPEASGSSVGVSFVEQPTQWAAAVDRATEHGEALAEEWLDGPEHSVTLLGREPLPPIAIRSPRPLFDETAKYDDEATEFEPLAADRVDARRLQDLAVAAADACHTRGLVRVDLRAPRRDPDDVRVLEINSVPGMSERSLAPLAAAAAGMSLEELAWWMVGDVHET